MRFPFPRFFLLAIPILLILFACNLPTLATPNAADAQSTAVALTVAALQTQVLLPATAAVTAPPIASATETATLAPVATPQNPLVVKDSLCWLGPGAQYEVVSAVKNGQRVELLGRGSIGAWWIIDNPIYHDPCWVAGDVLQFDDGYNLSGLKVFNPPPTPTNTPTKTPTPTATPTP